MRRVVVTGLGLVTPLGGDVETTLEEHPRVGKSGAGPITHFDACDQKCRIACEVKPADHEYGFDPDKRVDHKVQRQVDPFIVFGIDAAGQAIEDAGLTDMDEATRLRAGVSIGSGIGGLPGIESESLVLAREGPGPGQPALRPRPADQPHLRPGLDQIRADGPEPRGGHRLLDRRAFDRRRGADDQGRRRRHHARRRRRGDDLPDRHRRLRPGARAQHQLQRPAGKGQPPLRQGPRRLRHGRGRGRRRARGI